MNLLAELNLDSFQYGAGMYLAEVLRVIDGDTIKMRIDCGFSVHVVENLRLAGVDTPEIRGEEREQGLVSKAFVEDILPVGSKVLIKTSLGTGKYGRYIADVIVNVDDSLKSLSELLLEKGLAEGYPG